jgi:glycosyltransferase involved in cell wall biosynthesis
MGGLEKLLVECARHTDRTRFDLTFISLSGRGAPADEIEACGWPVVTLNVPPGRVTPGLVFRLGTWFWRLRIDVVHSHNNGPLIYGSPGARLAGVRGVIHTRHGLNSRASSRQTALVRTVIRLTDRIVCVSKSGARQSARQGVPPNRLQMLWNGIDVNRFSYAGPQAGGPAVLVARLSPEKDVATLLHAAALVRARIPSFRLAIAGDGPCLRDLQHLTARLGLVETVQFLGQVRDVPALLSRASLFVLPSLTEGISLTLLEAMARGLPVVATAVGGNPEVVLDGRTGFLVPPERPPALAEKMIHLMTNHPLAQEFGHSGRQRVEEFFNVRHMVESYENLYEQFACRKPTPGIAGVMDHTGSMAEVDYSEAGK